VTAGRGLPSRAWRVFVLTLPALAAPVTAHAHLVTSGLGPVYDGVSHVLVSPDDLIPIVAMAMLAGLNGPAAGRRVLFTLTGAWLAGGVLGHTAGPSSAAPLVTTMWPLVLGLLIAVDRRLPSAIVVGTAAAVGLANGWLNGSGMAADGNDGLGLAGIAAATFVIAALVSSVAVSLGHGPGRMVVRVAGSWIAAIGLLVLGWSLRA
jgi:urease accessory protein